MATLATLHVLFELAGVKNESLIETIHNETSWDADDQIEKGLMNFINHRIDTIIDQADRLSDEVQRLNDLNRQLEERLSEADIRNPLQSIIETVTARPELMNNYFGSYKTERIDDFVHQGRKIDGIRELRQTIAMGLREAKEMFEARQEYIKNNSTDEPNPCG